MLLTAGMKFGKLTALRKSNDLSKSAWECVCDCGKSSVVRTNNLIRGLSKSCGCNRHRPSANRVSVCSGERFKRLTVIQELTGIYYESRKQKVRLILCRCDCGKDVRVAPSVLLRGRITSCGCFREERRKHTFKGGETYNSLTVIREVDKQNDKRRVHCRCVCGTEVNVDLTALVTGHTRSCGCIRVKTYNKMPDALLRRIGEKNGFATLVEILERGSVDGERGCVILCDCGERKQVRLSRFFRGGVFSCGCRGSNVEWRKLAYVFHRRIKVALKRAFLKCGSSKGGKKTFELLGYNSQELVTHLSRFIGSKCAEKRVCNGIVLTIGNSHIDHITPVSSISKIEDVVRLNQRDNLRLICGPCNVSKNDIWQRDLFIEASR